MINLDLEIEETSRYPGADQQQQLEARDRVEQLKMEKREAMDYCEKKNVLSTGAAESMQRRLQGGSLAANCNYNAAASFYDIHPKTPWTNESERASSPVSSSHPSQVPTLSSLGQTCETTSSDSPTLRATTTTAVSSPAGIDPATACEPAPSPTDAWKTALSTTSEHSIPDDSPTGMIPINSPTRRKFPEAVPNDERDFCIYRETRQLFSAGLSIFEDPAAREAEHHHHHSRWISQAHTPARKPVPLRGLAALSTPNLLLGSSSPEVLASPGGSQVFGPPSPLTPRSMYPEPPPTPQPPSAQVGTVRRQSRVGGRSKKRSWSLQLDNPLPPLAQGRGSRLAENAPEPVTGHVRSHSASGMREEPARSRTTYRCRTPQQPRFTPLPPIADIGSECIPGPVGGGPAVDYETSPIEMPYKLHTKDSCFGTFISADAKHALFLSPHSFQVFAVPTPEQAPQLKPKFQYRLGEWEGLKKSKVRWQYKTAAVSDRHVVTITKERVRLSPQYYLARD